MNWLAEKLLIPLLEKLAPIALGKFRSMIASHRAKPEKGWIEALNSAFEDRVKVVGLVTTEPEISLGGYASLTKQQYQSAKSIRTELVTQRHANELHGVLLDEPNWESNPIKFNVGVLDFAEVQSLRKEEGRPALLSSSAVILCPESKELIMHQRTSDSATYAGLLHTVGGGYRPAFGKNASTDHLSLLRALKREIREETDMDIETNAGKVPLIISRELQTGFVQLVALGLTVSKNQVTDAKDGWEGKVLPISVDKLSTGLGGQIVPSGMVHLLAWLAFGAPGLGVFRRIDGKRPRKLFWELVEKYSNQP